MQIIVRPGSTIKEKTPSVSGFLNSLGAQAARYAEPQTCEVTPNTPLNLFGIRVPMTRELFRSAEWEYQIIRKQGTLRFTINGITVAAKCVGKLEEAWIRGLPQDLENLTLTQPTSPPRRKGLPAGAKVGSIDRFHGQEAPIVILSLCSSAGEFGVHGLEFILDRNPQRRDLPRPSPRRSRRRPRNRLHLAQFDQGTGAC